MKYLFFDIDGTLIGKSRQITRKTLDKLFEIKNKGHHIFICTGRAPTSINGGSLEDVPSDGFIASAGGYIKIGDTMIFRNSIDPHILQEVLTLFVNHHVLYALETEKAIYQSPGVNEFFDMKHHREFGENVELQRFFELKRRAENRLSINDFNINKTTVAKVQFIAVNKFEFLDIVKYLSAYFNIVTFSSPDDDFINGELILRSCTKAHGVKRILDYLHGDIEETIGFGDSMNDYQMLEICHTSVVSKKAPSKVKALGTYFFNDPDQDGIAEILEQLNI
ncbi:cof-like hydrolase [Eggerthia catenaformis OT 569 = DSM 20559]|uniref:Cof-like hydrolase n=1 Tax=Eggerthia catenaformis OT 569 = DSM 20559 TaxID=999415 RepID=M2P8K0_9FIRM|nr:HAD family hydrolase [Eggerthia catenaformis]EMD16662.1 cof-like hydrolase [Eggerthia catenaformis OT 569 = DSM 20559]